jgi:hypothetical protein
MRWSFLRWSLALALGGAIATGAAGAAQSGQPLTYWRITGGADFFYSLDYGSHPDSHYNGGYQAHLRYSITALAVSNGRRISTMHRALVSGSASVADDRTLWTSTRGRIPYPCDKAPTSRTHGGRLASGSYVLAGNGSFHVDPGTAVDWPVGCAATESLEHHGLPGGKSISGAAAAGARFVACSDTYSHEFTPPNEPDGHAFYGRASFSLKFTRISKSGLPDARRAMRKQVGREIRYRPPAGRYRDCLDTR